MDFNNAAELLKLTEENNCRISDIMLEREISEGGLTKEQAIDKMAEAWRIMQEAATAPAKHPVKSMGGLIGGESKKLTDHLDKSLAGSLISKAMIYAVGVMEVNASMGVIVAAPTAGSSGIVPGVLLAMKDEYHFSDEGIIAAMFNASAIGYIAMRNATVAGAEGGCQAEVGVATAMASSAAVELMGGTPSQCMEAASVCLMNLLGLVCDPVGGLVEYPCQNRNVAGVSIALTSAEMSLAGIRQLIPLDEMIQTMYNVGKRIPFELRETALGGCAVCQHAMAAFEAAKATKGE